MDLPAQCKWWQQLKGALTGRAEDWSSQQQALQEVKSKREVDLLQLNTSVLVSLDKTPLAHFQKHWGERRFCKDQS